MCNPGSLRSKREGAPDSEPDPLEEVQRQAAISKDRGDLDAAIRLYEEAECICRQLGNLDGLQQTLGCHDQPSHPLR